MSEFHVGDRVRCLCRSSAAESVGRQLGTICIMGNYWPPISVCWDEKRDWFHDCDDTCQYGYGYFVYENDLELVFECCPEDDFDIEVGDLL